MTRALTIKKTVSAINAPTALHIIREPRETQELGIKYLKPTSALRFQAPSLPGFYFLSDKPNMKMLLWQHVPCNTLGPPTRRALLQEVCRSQSCHLTSPALRGLFSASLFVMANLHVRSRLVTALLARCLS